MRAQPSASIYAGVYMTIAKLVRSFDTHQMTVAIPMLARDKQAVDNTPTGAVG